MIYPIPNVLHNNLEEAIKRLYEYKLDINYLETNEYLPNEVISYEPNEKEDTLKLVVSKPPFNNFSLDEKIEYVYLNNFVTGRNSINKDLLVSSKAGVTDLGIVVKVNDEYLYLYGDTFSGIDVNDGYWFSNFIAISDNKLNLDKEIRFNKVIKDEYGDIKPIKQGKHHRNNEKNLDIFLNKEVSIIPTGGIQIKDKVYIFMMSVRYWGKDGEWFVSRNDLYEANVNDLSNFKKVENYSFEEKMSNRFMQIFPYRLNDYIYFITIPGGRNGHLSLLRVKEEDFLDLNKYELLVNENEFLLLKKGLKLKPYYLIDDYIVGEPSIMFNKYLNKFVISTLCQDGIRFFYSDEISKKFKETSLILSHEQVKTCYGCFLHDDFIKYNGKKIYTQVSQWSPIYNTSLVEIVFK